MQHRNETDSSKTSRARGTTTTASHRMTASFSERESAEVALNDLEQYGVPRTRTGMIIPRGSRHKTGPPTPEKQGSGDQASPGSMGSIFPGWTTGMAPWVVSGSAPLTALGSLSLTRSRERPRDLKELAALLGLNEEGIEPLRSALHRNDIFVTVDAPEKEAIITNILERNGGRMLPSKTD